MCGGSGNVMCREHVIEGQRLCFPCHFPCPSVGLRNPLSNQGAFPFKGMFCRYHLILFGRSTRWPVSASCWGCSLHYGQVTHSSEPQFSCNLGDDSTYFIHGVK